MSSRPRPLFFSLISAGAVVLLVFLAAAYAMRARGMKESTGAGSGSDSDSGAGSGGEAHLFIGGDVHFGAHTPLLGDVGALVAPGLGIMNLEGPTTTALAEASASRESRLLNATSGLRSLAVDGVRVLGIANNHARDLSPNGIEETARHVRDAGIVPAGGSGSAGAAVIETPAGRVVVTAHELGVPLDKSSLERDLSKARARGDFLVATFHVTGPPSYLPRPELRAAVDMAIAAGARIIAAHGTHAIGPVERRKSSAADNMGKSDDVVIAWGLGNLLFACACSREREGAVLDVTIIAPLRDGQQLRAAIIPILAGLDGEPARLDPAPELVFDLLKALGSSPLERKGPRAVF